MAEPTVPRQFDSTLSRIHNRADSHALQTAIQKALTRAGYGELRCVELECEGDAVTISGRVPTYYLKHLVQRTAMSTPGIGQVNNELDVC
jgi:osmotically-inducible protein OsmY